jgi:cobalt/nickel transport system ATP-binding protein
MLFELKNISYKYPDGTLALAEVTMSIGGGERVAILGANGSGKSSLLRLLNGLVFAASGSLQFEGSEITDASLKAPKLRLEFRRRVGFVFQNAEAQLFNATAFEEVAFGPRQIGMNESDVAERASETLRFLGIEHLADRSPFRLSGGEKRKVAIASVLSMNPDVILLDEPYLGLDPRSQSWLHRTLTQLQEVGKTTIVATHTLGIVRQVADRAIVLDEDHRVAADGDATDVLANYPMLCRANLVDDAAFAVVGEAPVNSL